MTQPIIDPLQFVDRDEERRLFDDLVKRCDDARVLTVRDGSGMGKSQLLGYFYTVCSFTLRIPVSLTALEDVPDRSQFELVRKVALDLGHDRCPLFAEADHARVWDKPEFFATPRGGVRGAGAEIGGHAVVANRIETVLTGTTQHIYVQPARTEWTPQREEDARRRCVNAFFEDLRKLTTQETTVLIFDAYDKAGGLAAWIAGELLSKHIFDPSSRCEGLVVVVAGQQVPPLRGLLQDRYDVLVRAIDPLSPFEAPDVEKLLRLRNLSPTPDLVNKMIKLLRAGVPIIDALTETEVLRLEAAA